MIKRHAIIDESTQYRYLLSRQWGSSGYISWIMLNPSTADAMEDDPTIRRCIGFTQAWGYGGLQVVNLYAYRSTSPNLLRMSNDPVGPFHQKYFRESLDGADKIIAAWGSHAMVRISHVREFIESRVVWCLGINKDGNPKHPLYLPGSAELQRYQLAPAPAIAEEGEG